MVKNLIVNLVTIICKFVKAGPMQKCLGKHWSKTCTNKVFKITSQLDIKAKKQTKKKT